MIEEQSEAARAEQKERRARIYLAPRREAGRSNESGDGTPASGHRKRRIRRPVYNHTSLPRRKQASTREYPASFSTIPQRRARERRDVCTSRRKRSEPSRKSESRYISWLFLTLLSVMMQGKLSRENMSEKKATGRTR